VRVVPLLMTALLAHLTAGTPWARIPRACHRCHAVRGDAISECVAAAAASCPTAPRRKAHRCLRRLVDQTVGVDKVCAEQQLLQGHATVSFIKNDGTPCTVTVYAQGTRVVAGQ